MASQKRDHLGTERFWEFSLRVYARPEVSETCLDLQDSHGFDVNLLLLCLWLAEERSGALDRAAVQALSAALAPWSEAATIALRRIRRRLKTFTAPYLSHEDAMRCRELIQQAELEAERVAQHMLVAALGEQPIRTGCPSSEAAEISLASYQDYLGAAAAEAALKRLCRLILPA